jgi:signal peptidase II
MFEKKITGIKAIALVLIVLLVISLDQITKWYVVNRGGFFINENFLDIGLYKNFGTAFGIPIPYFILYPIIVIALVLITLRYWNKIIQKDFLTIFSCLLVFGGAVSNLFDRIYRGYVVDYIHFSFGSTFNLADVLIVAGICLLMSRELGIINKKKYKNI